MSSRNGNPYYKFSTLVENLYSGMVHLYDETGQPVIMQYYGKGELMSSILHDSFDEAKTLPTEARCSQRYSLAAACQNTWDCDPPQAPGGCGGSENGHWELQYTPNYTDWYFDRNGDGQAQSSEYGYREDHGYSSEYVWVNSNVAGPLYGFPYYSYYSYDNVNPPVRLAFNPQGLAPSYGLTLNLFAFMAHPCANEVVRKLQEKDHSLHLIPDINDQEGIGHLSQAILDLFDSSQEYDLHMDIKQLGYDSNGNELNGQIDRLDDGRGWKIWLDKDLANNGTKLFIAKTMIHESMHAFILYVMGKNQGSEMQSDIVDLWHTFKGDSKIRSNMTHHEFMSQYVDALANSLSVWDNHQQSKEYYKMLSWGGLESSDTYDTKSVDEKRDIQNAIRNERYDESGAVGEPCD